MHHHLFHRPGAPLPGTEPPLRGLFVDRWGTLLERPPQGFAKRFESVAFTERAVDALFRASQRGWLVYLIGNEEAVWSGRWSSASWQRFEAELLAHLAKLGVPVRRNYACLDHPEGKGEHRRDSVYLLPNTGAIYHAAQTDGIAVEESWMIGDSTLELVAGWRAGCNLASVRTGLALSDATYHVDPEVRAANLADALEQIDAMVRAR